LLGLVLLCQTVTPSPISKVQKTNGVAAIVSRESRDDVSDEPIRKYTIALTYSESQYCSSVSVQTSEIIGWFKEAWATHLSGTSFGKLVLKTLWIMGRHSKQ
jgi:hypothetical protein